MKIASQANKSVRMKTGIRAPLAWVCITEGHWPVGLKQGGESRRGGWEDGAVLRGEGLRGH